MRLARVVHLKKRPYDVYIGRANSVNRLAQSKWHNQFVIGVDGTRSEVIAKYRDKLLETPELMAALPELEHLVLGCWCKPHACHGDVLADLVNKNMKSRNFLDY